VIRPDGTALRLDTGGALLGVFPDWKYQQGDIELGSGDRLVLFTDGVSEVQDSEGHEFGEERLIQLLTKSRELNAVELQQKVIGEITAFSSGDFHDDVTLLLMAVL
jgi:serine phosphatase RsbU (regulator of sigma subunit)